MTSKVHPKIAKSSFGKLLPELCEKGGKAEEVAKSAGVIIEQDEGALEGWVDEVIAANPKAVGEFKEGQKNAVNFLMGQVMKASRGKANPPMVIKMINQKLR